MAQFTSFIVVLLFLDVCSANYDHGDTSTALNKAGRGISESSMADHPWLKCLEKVPILGYLPMAGHTVAGVVTGDGKHYKRAIRAGASASRSTLAVGGAAVGVASLPVVGAGAVAAAVAAAGSGGVAGVVAGVGAAIVGGAAGSVVGQTIEKTINGINRDFQTDGGTWEEANVIQFLIDTGMDVFMAEALLKSFEINEEKLKLGQITETEYLIENGKACLETKAPEAAKIILQEAERKKNANRAHQVQN